MTSRLEHLKRLQKWPCVSSLNLPLVALLAAIPVWGQQERKVTQLAEGVYAIQHEPNGNTTVIIGDRQVFVVDSCFLPSAAHEDISQIRTWTDKPVTFVLNTHFHNDHNLGNRIYMMLFSADGHRACGDQERHGYVRAGLFEARGKTKADILQMQNGTKDPPRVALISAHFSMNCHLLGRVHTNDIYFI